MMNAVSFGGLAALFPGQPFSLPENVVAAEGRFGIQKYSWKPAKEDWRGLLTVLEAAMRKKFK